MLDQKGRGWLPQVFGVIALLLALEKVRWLAFVSPDNSQEFLLGIELTGRPAWMASALLALLAAWISAGSFRRRRQMVWVIMGYCVYLAASYCVWLGLYSPHSDQTKLISGAFFAGAMLSLCRYIVDRKEQFDQQ